MDAVCENIFTSCLSAQKRSSSFNLEENTQAANALTMHSLEDLEEEREMDQ